MNIDFVPRTELTDHEWDNETQRWERPKIERETLKQLNQRSTLNGMVRLVVHTLCITAAGWLTVYAARYHLLLAVIPYLFFTFLVGFLNGIEHEMRHKIVFSQRLDRFSDAVFFLIHVLLKDGAQYQRASHIIHHSHTMVFGVDPEGDFPEVITVRWVWKTLLSILFNVLLIGIPSFLMGMWTLIQRSRGNINPMVLARCSEVVKKKIQREALAVLLINIAALVVFIVWQQWFLIALLILGPRVGLAIVSFWFQTEHIGMMYNSSDQRMCTRGVKVSRFVRFLYGGLDEHVEHHLFPGVPSRNLTRLREAITWKIPERQNVLQCWREIFTIARHKETHPGDVFVPQM